MTAVAIDGRWNMRERKEAKMTFWFLACVLGVEVSPSERDKRKI